MFFKLTKQIFCNREQSNQAVQLRSSLNIGQIIAPNENLIVVTKFNFRNTGLHRHKQLQKRNSVRLRRTWPQPEQKPTTLPLRYIDTADGDVKYNHATSFAFMPVPAIFPMLKHTHVLKFLQMYSKRIC